MERVALLVSAVNSCRRLVQLDVGPTVFSPVKRSGTKPDALVKRGMAGGVPLFEISPSPAASRVHDVHQAQTSHTRVGSSPARSIEARGAVSRPLE